MSPLIGAKDDDEGDDWGYKACKAPVKMTPSTNQHPAYTQYSVFVSSMFANTKFLQGRCPSCRPTKRSEH